MTPVPGTTRDVIEEVFNVQGIPVRLMDTAGLRKTVDTVEREGVKKTKEKMDEADLLLLVIDGSRELDEDDQEILQKTERRKRVLAVNKKDLPVRVSEESLKAKFENDPIVHLSALKNEEINGLKEAIYASLIHRDVENLLIT